MIKWGIAIAVISVVLVFTLPIPQVFRGVASLPAVVAMIGILSDVWRDSMSHRRQKELQRQEHDFTLGIASHMANVTFNKHIEFCEEYFQAVNSIVNEHLSAGPNDTAYAAARKLQHVREKYSPWLTRDIEDALLPTEIALARVGASSALLERLPVGSERERVVNEMFELWSVVVGVKSTPNESERQSAAIGIRDHFRSVLGVDALTTLRSRALATALSRAK
jgi:hypothetical protein